MVMNRPPPKQARIEVITTKAVCKVGLIYRPIPASLTCEGKTVTVSVAIGGSSIVSDCVVDVGRMVITVGVGVTPNVVTVTTVCMNDRTTLNVLMGPIADCAPTQAAMPKSWTMEHVAPRETVTPGAVNWADSFISFEFCTRVTSLPSLLDVHGR